jgi:hypothetical protein
MTPVRLAIAFALLVSVAAGAVAAGEPGTDAQREIAHLLQYLEASKCAFYRNGAWHSSLEARAHLEDKYNYLKNRFGAVSAEDFLAHAATASSFSGSPYQVRCEGKEAVASAKWLEAELLRYRATITGAGK